MQKKNIFHETSQFSRWLEKLRDTRGRARIAARIDSAKAGNFGDCKALDDGICEMRIDFGLGYRLYYAQEGLHVICLWLAGISPLRKRISPRQRSYGER